LMSLSVGLWPTQSLTQSNNLFYLDYAGAFWPRFFYARDHTPPLVAA
jgi:hypothetical protein